MRNAVDFSYARPAGVLLAALGLDALGYTGNARPDQAYLSDLAAHGIEWTFIQETTSDRAQQGYGAGILDAQFADGRADQRLYPRSRSIAYAVSDGNRYDPSTNGDRIADYGEAIARTSLRPFFFYGNRYAVEAAMRGAARAAGAQCLGAWVPSTWDARRGADALVQEANLASPIADTDLNTVYKVYGRWGQDYPAPVPEEDDMPHIAQLKALDGRYEMMLVDGGYMNHDFGLAEVGAPFNVPSAWRDWKAVDATRDALKRIDYDRVEWDAVRERSKTSASKPVVMSPEDREAIAESVASKVHYPTTIALTGGGTLQ